jgi:protein gp37
MAQSSDIEWTDATWNPLAGCTPVSPGCLNCYAAGMAVRLAAMGKADYAPRRESEQLGTPYDKHTPAKTVHLAVRNNGRAVFTGEVRTLPHKLSEPLKWKKPRRVFVNSMSDLFHKDVPFEFIDQVFGVMAITPEHTYQILTKRPERMAEYMQSLMTPEGHMRAIQARDKNNFDQQLHGAILRLRMGTPLPNVWLGTSVENQATADERIPHLLRVPAAVRFLSMEPLLGPVDLRRVRFAPTQTVDAFTGRWSWNEAYPHTDGGFADLSGKKENASIRWVIVGGESGPNSRSCNIDGIRSIIKQCHAAGVPCFVKQLGAKPFDTKSEAFCEFTNFQTWVNKASSWLGGVSGGGMRYKRPEKVVCVDAVGRVCNIGADFMRARDEGKFPVTAHFPMNLRDLKGGDMSEWPEDMRVRHMPKAGQA